MTMHVPMWLGGLAVAALLGGCTGADDGEDHPTRDDGGGSSGDDGGDGGDGGGSGSGDGDSGEPEIDCDIGMEEGNCAPDFTVLDQTGDEVSLSDLDGAPRLIIGTAAW